MPEQPVMPTRVTLRLQLIMNDKGEHSFQFFNPFTNTVSFASPEWFATKSAAQQKAIEIRDTFIKRMATQGITLDLPTIDDAPDTFLTIPVQQPVIQRAAEMLSQRQQQAQGKIIYSLAIHETTNKFGYVVCLDSGELLLEPIEWSDTPEAAYQVALTNLADTKEKVQKLVIERNLGDIKFLADFGLPPGGIPPEVSADLKKLAAARAPQPMLVAVPPGKPKFDPPPAPGKKFELPKPPAQKPWRMRGVPDDFNPNLN